MEIAAPHPPHVRQLFKSILKGSSLYLIASISPNIASLLLIRIVTGRLTTADYGALDMIQQVSVILTLVLGINIGEALGFFFFEQGADKGRVVSTILSGAAILGAIAGVLGWLMTGTIGRYIFHSSDYDSCLRLIFVTMPLGFLLEAALAWLRVEDRAALFTGLTILRMLIGLIGTVVLLVAFDMKVAGVVISNVAASIVVAVILAITALRKYGLRFQALLFRRILRFSVFITLSSCALFIIHFGDRFVLTQFRPYSEIGIYALAYKMGMLVSLVQVGFGTYWAAQIFQIVKRHDAGWVFARCFTYYLTGLAFCGIGLLVASKPAFKVLTTPAYYGALSLIPIIVLAYLIRSIGDFFRWVFVGLGHPKYDAISNWIAASICIAAYFVLIPRFGIFGAAWATLITFVCVSIVAMAWVYRLWPYQLESSRLAKLAVAATLIVFLHYALPSASFASDVLEGIALLVGFALLLVVLRFPTSGETSSIRSAVFRFMPLRAAGSTEQG